MAVTVFFWRALKGPRAKVLLNLCAAIAFVCALVIFEGSARDKVCLIIYAVSLLQHIFSHTKETTERPFKLSSWKISGY